MKKEDKKWNIVLGSDELFDIRRVLIAWETYLELEKIPRWQKLNMNKKDLNLLIKEKEEAGKMADLLLSRFTEAERVKG